MLRSRNSRAAVVSFVVALVGGGVASAWDWPKKIDWYFYTKAPPPAYDRKSGAGSSWLIDSEIMPTALSWSDAKRRAQNEFDERCKVAFQPNIPLWAEHRGVTLCNAARLPELDFSNALAEFKEQVNVRHWRNVEQRTVHAISRIAAAIGLWITLIGAYYVARWVYRGDPKGQDTGA